MELVRAEGRPVPSSMFEVPAGYKEEDQTSMAMGQMSPEQQENMKKAMESLTPEQRKAMEDAMKKRQ
jgi:hypothetical protein